MKKTPARESEQNQSGLIRAERIANLIERGVPIHQIEGQLDHDDLIQQMEHDQKNRRKFFRFNVLRLKRVFGFSEVDDKKTVPVSDPPKPAQIQG